MWETLFVHTDTQNNICVNKIHNIIVVDCEIYLFSIIYSVRMLLIL